VDAQLRRKLFFEMLRIRMIEEGIADEYGTQEIRCPVHLSIGQEAVAVGVCAALDQQDYVMSTHRGHAHYLAKGGSLRAMMAELYGRATGCSQGKGGSMHLVDLSVGFLGATPIVGSTIPIGVGLSFASLMLGDGRVTVTFFGEGATEEGVFHESLNFAALKKLPVVFVCENNLYSVYSPLSVRQPEGREVFWLAQGHGIESYQGDGNDVVEVYNLARKAAGKARQGGGPTFLELKTYRWREHCGPNYDNHIGYRSESEFQEWKQRCPVKEYEQRLIQDGTLSAPEVAKMAAEVRRELEDAVAFAQHSPLPDETLLMQHIYAP
jgi:TPP-dependent pyruvate/acetoin dehydrogenase alpha subunit